MTELTDTERETLREVALAATPGQWTAHEGDLEGKPASEYARTLFANREKDGTTTGRLFLTQAQNDIDPEFGDLVVPAITGDGPRAMANAEHIASFSPATALALLDDLDALTARLARVEAAGICACSDPGWTHVRDLHAWLAAHDAAIRADHAAAGRPEWVKSKTQQAEPPWRKHDQ